jgi:hypothetical protein
MSTVDIVALGLVLAQVVCMAGLWATYRKWSKTVPIPEQQLGYWEAATAYAEAEAHCLKHPSDEVGHQRATRAWVDFKEAKRRLEQA